jgi:hypothetical protein
MKWAERMTVKDEYGETWRGTAVKTSQYLPWEPKEIL